jgi:hypothetical protein
MGASDDRSCVDAFYVPLNPTPYSNSTAEGDSLVLSNITRNIPITVRSTGVCIVSYLPFVQLFQCNYSPILWRNFLRIYAFSASPRNFIVIFMNQATFIDLISFYSPNQNIHRSFTRYRSLSPFVTHRKSYHWHGESLLLCLALFPQSQTDPSTYCLGSIRFICSFHQW